MNNWDKEVTLIQVVYESDKIGNQIETEQETTVLCKTRSIGSNEFYSAGQGGYRPEIEIIVHPYEYDGQSQLIYEGKKYRVIRTYQSSLEEIELTCEVSVGVN